MWWTTAAMAVQPMVLQVVDADSGDPIPCATLTTVHQVVGTSDDEGLVAFVEPSLVGQDVWFTPEAQGYRMAPDWLGLVGEAFRIRDGGYARIELQRGTGPVAACPDSDHARRLIDAGLPDDPMRIEVVDRATGRGVPLARVEGGDGRWITDSAGNVAMIDPTLYGQEVAFRVADWHGYGPSAPVLATIEDGGHVVIEVDRRWPAERLYRITGADPFRDSALLGLPIPFPALQGEVVGLDSCLSVQVNGSTLWMFGDTLRPSYPLGHFDTAAAWVSGDPDQGVSLDYLVGADGFSRGIADLSDDGPVWLAIPTPVDDGGTDVLLAVFGVFSGLAAQQRGFAVLDPVAMSFEPVAPLPLDLELAHQTPIRSGGFVTLREGLRFPDTLAEAIDTTSWQTWSPLVGGVVDRHPDGSARWAWRNEVLLPDGDRLPVEDRWPAVMLEPDEGTVVEPHYGDVARNAHARRFLQVFTRTGGETAWLGELWLAQADTPFGPWSYARRIEAFDDYTVYNPMILSEFDTDGRQIYLQGTYTDFLSGAAVKTPRYDYNQLMFRLDLDDPRARLPAAYFLDPSVDAPTPGPRLPDTASDPVLAFHAYDRPLDGAVAVGRSVAACAGGTWEVGAPADPLLWGADAERTGLVPLWNDGGTLSTATPAGSEPLAWVWPAVGASHVPAHDYLPPWRLDGGADRCVDEDAPGVGAIVLLHAESSAGDLAWSVDGQSATGAEARFVLPAGDHAVHATLTTPEGAVLEDVVLVNVEPLPPVDPTTTTTPTEPESSTTLPPGTTPTDPARPDRADSDDCGCRQGGTSLPCLALFSLLARRQPRQARRIER